MPDDPFERLADYEVRRREERRRRLEDMYHAQVSRVAGRRAAGPGRMGPCAMAARRPADAGPRTKAADIAAAAWDPRVSISPAEHSLRARASASRWRWRAA